MAPFKRARQPKMTTQALLDFDLGESSSDSDFRIEDHNTSDDNSDVSKDEDSAQDDSSSDDDCSSDDNSNGGKLSFLAGTEAQTNGGNNFLSVFKKVENKCKEKPKFPLKPICCICLGDRSDDTNEIVECDNCGVSVHEFCYGVSDDSSISSTNSTCSTEPWFCDACRAGVDKPVCELCPNTFTSIYKETDVGKWVHLVCALYVPGVAFGEVDRLANVTLFEMQYNKWGNRVCSLCEDPKMARTGVSIECDAGFCKNYFHATCAQAAGFLIEAHHDEAEAADPFYAQCKAHSDSEVVKKRKRNYQIFSMNMAQKQLEKPFDAKLTTSPAQQRIQRKLLKSQRKYENYRKIKSDAWVPTQRLPRVLDTSATALRILKKKTQGFGVDAEGLERQNAQIAAVTNIRKKWQIPAAFSVEFVAYYLDRIPRANELKEQLAKMVKSNDSLTEEQNTFRKEYDANLEKNKLLKKTHEANLAAITLLHNQLTALCPTKQLPNPANIGHRIPNEPPKSTVQPSRPISVPTAAALKMGVGFPLAHLGPPGTKVNSNRLLSTHAKHAPNVAMSGSSSAPTTPTLGVHAYDCGICKRCTDQHLLVKCDTCKLYYHLGCLNPPLTRHPKKSKLYGWQCSECDKSDVSDAATEIPKGPRKSRTRFNKDGSIIPKHILHMQAIKRRSTDDADRHKKKQRLNNSLPDIAHLYDSSAKKPKVLLKNISPQLASMEKLTSAVKASLESFKESTPQTNLATSEPLVVVEQNPEAIDPLALPSNNNASLMLNSTKPARKQKRKGKHKSKHNESSESDKSPNKEHKRKRKKKVYDFDYPSDQLSSIPQIKIKFKTLPLPGEVTPEAQFRYVPADMVRSAEECSRPTSVETVEDASPSELAMTPAKAPQQIVARRKSSPRKANQRMSFESSGRKSRTGVPDNPNFICCVCSDVGMSLNAVTCDECGKHYHFTCLEPPLKKTPKIRGYSWHCADCDPTDEEHK